MKNISHQLLIAISCALLIACATSQPEKSLFVRLGGLPVITVVVSETIDETSTNPKTKRSFEGIKLPALKESVVKQICNLTGGGCVYEGETMKKSHADARITTAEFELFVEEFRRALNRHVPTREKNELLKILAPMKRDIVNTSPKTEIQLDESAAPPEEAAKEVK